MKKNNGRHRAEQESRLAGRAAAAIIVAGGVTAGSLGLAPAASAAEQPRLSDLSQQNGSGNRTPRALVNHNHGTDNPSTFQKILGGLSYFPLLIPGAYPTVGTGGAAGGAAGAGFSAQAARGALGATPESGGGSPVARGGTPRVSPTPESAAPPRIAPEASPQAAVRAATLAEPGPSGVSRGSSGTSASIQQSEGGWNSFIRGAAKVADDVNPGWRDSARLLDSAESISTSDPAAGAKRPATGFTESSPAKQSRGMSKPSWSNDRGSMQIGREEAEDLFHNWPSPDNQPSTSGTSDQPSTSGTSKWSGGGGRASWQNARANAGGNSPSSESSFSSSSPSRQASPASTNGSFSPGDFQAASPERIPSPAGDSGYTSSGSSSSGSSTSGSSTSGSSTSGSSTSGSSSGYDSPAPSSLDSFSPRSDALDIDFSDIDSASSDGE